MGNPMPSIPVLILGSDAVSRAELAKATWDILNAEDGHLLGAITARPNPLTDDWMGHASDFFTIHRDTIRTKIEMDMTLATSSAQALESQDPSKELDGALIFCTENVVSEYVRFVMYAQTLLEKSGGSKLLGADGKPLANSLSNMELVKVTSLMKGVQLFMADALSLFFGGVFLFEQGAGEVINLPDGRYEGDPTAVEHRITCELLTNMGVSYNKLGADVEEGSKAMAEVLSETFGLGSHGE